MFCHIILNISEYIYVYIFIYTEDNMKKTSLCKLLLFPLIKIYTGIHIQNFYIHKICIYELVEFLNCYCTYGSFISVNIFDENIHNMHAELKQFIAPWIMRILVVDVMNIEFFTAAGTHREIFSKSYQVKPKSDFI